MCNGPVRPNWYIYRTFHPKIMNFTFFSSAHGTFSKIDHILGHKSSLGKFKKNWNHFKNLFWSQCGKIRCQLQGGKKELLKIQTYGSYTTYFWITNKSHKISKKKSKFASVQFSLSVMSNSVRPHRRQPTRLPSPWDSPGKNAGVGCHFLLQCMKVKK